MLSMKMKEKNEKKGECQNGKRLRFLLDESFYIFPVGRSFRRTFRAVWGPLCSFVTQKGNFTVQWLQKLSLLLFFFHNGCDVVFGVRWSFMLIFVSRLPFDYLNDRDMQRCWLLLTVSLKPSYVCLLQNETRNRYSISFHMRPRECTIMQPLHWTSLTRLDPRAKGSWLNI